MAAKKGKAVTKKDSGTLVFHDEVPDYVDTGSMAGNEAVKSEDLTIPRVDVFQSLSPQINPRKSEYIEGAEPGLLFNTATEEIYGDEVTIIPVLFRKEYVIWKDRDSGGGFRGAFPTFEHAEKHREELEDANLCESVETAQHFCLVVKEDGSTEEAVISMSKSKLKCSRDLNTQARMRGGPRFATAYKLSSVEATNQNNQDYYNIKTKPLGWVPEELFHHAESMYESVRSGAKDVARDAPDAEGAEERY